MATLTAKNILLVEDDTNLGQVLCDFLELEGFTVTLASDGEAGYEEFSKSKFNICLLDIMLPKIDGFSLGKKIRKKDKDIPIIFLTAKSLKEDKLKGFDLGGDDYITKPFDEDELIRRINAILKRTAGVSDVSKLRYKLGKFEYNHINFTLNINDQESRITQKEGEVLHMLLQSKNNVVRREDILVKVWGENDYFHGKKFGCFYKQTQKIPKAGFTS